jgi:cysteine-rich repeat protein
MKFTRVPSLAATTVAVLLASLLSAAPARAGLGSWTSSGPRGATVRAIAFDPTAPGRAWAGVGTRTLDTSGLLFRTDDGGLTWTPSNAGLPDVAVQAIAVDPTSPATVWIGTDGAGIFRSVDAGATWAARSDGLEVPFVRGIAIDPTNTSVLYAATDLSVWKSTDAGSTWSLSADGLLLELEVNAVVVNPLSPAIVYAATAEGVYRSSNAGLSWSPMANTDLRNIVSLAIDPVTPTTLYATDDDGNAYRIKQGSNWAQKNVGLGSYPAANFVALDPSNPSVAWLGESGGAWKATDASGNLVWSEASTGLPANSSIGTLAVHPSGQLVLAGDSFGDGTYRTADAGGSWSRASAGLVATDVGAVIVDPAAPHATGGAMAGTSFAGVFRSADGGASWSRDQVARYVKILALAIDRTAPAVRYAGLDFQNGVWKSTDSGATWTTSGFSTAPVRALATDPNAHRTLYAATDAGVRKTTDGGTTWSAVNSGLTGLDVRALVAHPTVSGTLWAGTTSGVFATTDGGVTWSAFSTGLGTPDTRALLVDAAASPAVLWAGTTGGVFRRVLGDAAWTGVQAGLSNLDVRALAQDGQRTVYAGTFGGGAWKRGIEETAWSEMNTGLPVRRITSLAWDRRGGGRLYAGTQGRGVQVIEIPQPACGDGVVQAGEQCDDGNEATGDCCSPTCQVQNVGSACPEDGNPCSSDACDAGGTCAHPARPDGTACSDGDACTRTDACLAGICAGADPVECPAPGPCRAEGTCDPGTGTCSNPPGPDGAACDDGSACTRADACAGGACVGTDPVTCIPSDSCHLAGSCDPATGACSDPVAPDGASCDDGDGCTRVDACAAGTCLGSSPVACTPSDSCHLAGSCDPATGACSDPVAPDGTACSDGSACTEADACSSGACSGTPVDGCVSLDAFACYKAVSARVTPPVPAFASRTVPVRDAFRSAIAAGDLGVSLRKPAALCNPADQDGASGQASAKPGHGEAYAGRALESPFSGRVQAVRNRLGTLRLSVGKLAWVFTPSSVAAGPAGAPPLAGSDLTPFACYQAGAARLSGNAFTRSQVTVADSLAGPLVYDLLKPAHLCIAATLDGSDPPTGTGPSSLACYQVKLARTNPAQPRFQRTTVSTRNLFGGEALLLVTPQEICLPTELVD